MHLSGRGGLYLVRRQHCPPRALEGFELLGIPDLLSLTIVVPWFEPPPSLFANGFTKLIEAVVGGGVPARRRARCVPNVSLSVKAIGVGVEPLACVTGLSGRNMAVPCPPRMRSTTAGPDGSASESVMTLCKISANSFKPTRRPSQRPSLLPHIVLALSRERGGVRLLPGASIERSAHTRGVPQKHKIEVHDRLPPVVHPCANTYLNFASVHIGQPAHVQTSVARARSLGN
mgnify:CR=1 FL=1